MFVYIPLASEELVDLHIRLLRKKRKYINKDKWEKALVRFISEYSNVEAWELERYGYKNIKLAIKLNVLKVIILDTGNHETNKKIFLNSFPETF